jgi:hypothetical protein
MRVLLPARLAGWRQDPTRQLFEQEATRAGVFVRESLWRNSF